MKTIPLTQGRVALCDDDDYDYLMQWKWSFSKGSAVRNRKPSGTGMIYMHRVVMKTPEDMECDHLFGKTLDNRKSQLRNCTHSNNCKNQKLHNDSSTGFKGVHFAKREQKYLAKICTNYKQRFLGYFPTPELAHAAYCAAAVKYHGEFARTQ